MRIKLRISSCKQLAYYIYFIISKFCFYIRKMNTVFHDDALKVSVKQRVQGHIFFLMEDSFNSFTSSSANSVTASVETAVVTGVSTRRRLCADLLRAHPWQSIGQCHIGAEAMRIWKAN